MSEEAPQLPPAITSDEHAPPPAEQIIAEARKRFVIPDDAVSEQPPQPAVETKDEAPSKESAPEPKADETPEAKQDAKEAVEPEKELTPEQAEKRNQRRFERRLEKERRRAIEAQLRAEAAEKRAAEFEAKATPQKIEGMPKIEDFDYDPDKYAEAVVKWSEQRVTQDFEQRSREQSIRQQEQKLVSEWGKAVSKVDDKYEDFEDVVGEMVPDNPLSVAIMESDMGPEIAYYLAKHEDEADRLINLNPISQVRELGRLEAKLIAEASAPKKTPSKAPRPIDPVATEAAIASDIPSEKDDFETWMRKRNKQVHGARR